MAPRAPAAEEMLAAGLRHMPVLDENEVVGMVGARDALRRLTRTVLGSVEAAELRQGAAELERELAHLGG